jgi:hypothetical protein
VIGIHAGRVHFQYRYPADFPAVAQRQMESLRKKANASLRRKPIDSFADWSEAKRVWVLELASGAATIIGRIAAMENWSANQAREMLKDFTLQGARAAGMTAPAVERFFQSDEWKSLDDALFPFETPPGLTTFDELMGNRTPPPPAEIRKRPRHPKKPAQTAYPTAAEGRQRTQAAENTEAKTSQPDPKQKRKGDVTLLAGKQLVNFKVAEEYLGISDRQRQNLIKKGGPLEVKGQGSNRKITTESLLKYLPPENPQ